MPERCVLRRRRCGAGAPLLSSQRALDLMTTNGGRKCCRACSKKTALMAQCWCDKSMAQSSASSGHFRGASVTCCCRVHCDPALHTRLVHAHA
eukprot:scaffold249498_cov21-Tisochrysis_lutea.AAC.1